MTPIDSTDLEGSERFRRVEAEIHSDTSPVGIDAKKTHVMILMKLEETVERLARLEEQVASLTSKP